MEWTDLRDARLGPLTAAADAWERVAARYAEHTEHAIRMVADVHASRWEGETADVAYRYLERIDDELEATGIRAKTMASLLRVAGDTLTRLQRQLDGVIDDVSAHGFTIDADGRVRPPELTWQERHDPDGQAAYATASAAAHTLSTEIRRIVAAADTADDQLATGLSRLQGTSLSQDPEYGAAVLGAQAVAEMMGVTEDRIPAAGTEPAAVDAWWDGLSPEQQQILATAYPQRIGGLDGLPAADRDTANRLALHNYLTGFSGGNPNTGTHGDDGVPYGTAKLLLDRLESTEAGPEGTRLFLLSFHPDGDGTAAVAVGNPDTAANTAVVIPGVGTEMDDIRGQINRAADLQAAATGLGGGSTSVIAWVGYDTPGPGADLASAPFGDKSEAGAQALDHFVNGLNSAHDDSPSHLTAVGHSYGSTVIGEAASHGDGLAVDDIVALGSPGMRVDNVDELMIDPEHVYAGAAADDNFVARPEKTAGWIAGIPIVGSWLAAGAENIHGPAPHDPEFGGNVLRIDTSGHSGYWDSGSIALQSQAAVIIGDYDNVVEETP
ncbi:alpha/beta hydrolase [Catenuloplanes atrovinosus]|uniref:Alpha/beta hydrolase n=1 Tax=Catenuloplanes atrovinosus TaxID=137266 RepID=A0AAE3YNC2_9ACTN|nr:alpha/beta hydrolase [Catenuloplanes atrovinosus]MDR7275672.1 hypothetical protein [Catenuloplanes atrovinosus]